MNDCQFPYENTSTKLFCPEFQNIIFKGICKNHIWIWSTSQLNIAAAARLSLELSLLLFPVLLKAWSPAKVFRKPIVSERLWWSPCKISKSSALYTMRKIEESGTTAKWSTIGKNSAGANRLKFQDKELTLWSMYAGYCSHVSTVDES